MIRETQQIPSLPVLRWSLTAAMLLPLLGGACSSSRSDGKWFKKPRTSQDYLDMALEGATGDERRRGVIGLADSRDGRTDWAKKVFDTIARTDVDTAVRCAAVAALVPAAGPDQVSTAIKVLSSTSQQIEDVRAAPDAVRWEAAKLLLAIIHNYTYEEAQRGQIVQVLLERVARDKDRNVRLTSIDALSYFAQEPIPSALIDVMEQEEDFALQHAAESALITLTGHTHHHDAKAWRKWLAQNPDPFKDMGQTPPELQSADSKGIRWEWPW